MSVYGVQTQSLPGGPAWDAITNPNGFRAYVTLGRYAQPPVTHYATSPGTGRLHWFVGKQYRILRFVQAELEAGRDLHSTTVANASGCSQGYATKMLQRLFLWRFIVVTEVVLGRWGRIVAHIGTRLRQSFLHTRRNVSDYGGMINDRWGPYPLMGGAEADRLRDELVKLEWSGQVSMLPA